MPRKRRYALQPPAFSPDVPYTFERSVSVTDAELVNADPDGLDPTERASRRGRKSDAELNAIAERLLPHRSTVTPAMQVIHERRFGLWKLGMSCEDIAEQEDVDDRAVNRSVNYILSLLPDAEMLRLKNLHVAINTHKEHGRKYGRAMDKLLASDKSRDLDRGMTHFERAVGIAQGGVNVLVDNRHQVANINATAPTSFEQVMDAVRAKLLAERNSVTPQNDSIVESNSESDD